MKTFKQSFLAIKVKNPGYSDYDCFHQAQTKFHLKGQKLRKYLKELVHEDDYDKSELKALLKYLGGQ